MKKYTLCFLALTFVFGLFITNVNYASAQVSNVPGCLFGDNYSRTTGQRCVAPADCAPGDLFSSVTGFPCSVSITLPPGCTPVYKFSITTGMPCETRGDNAPVINGVSGPQSLNVNQQGTWTVTAYDKYGGNLSYSVSWGDEGYQTSAGLYALRPAQQSATFTHTYSQAGNYTPTFIVSSSNTIRCIQAPCPSNGGSAKTSLSVNVGGVITSGKPDITISGVVCDPANPKQYQFIYCDVTVYNNSSVNITKSFDVNIQGHAMTINAPLNAWEKRSIRDSRGFGLSILGINELNFPVDIWDSVDESNENNNTFTMNINVGGVNNAIYSLSPNSGRAGTQVTIYGSGFGTSGCTQVACQNSFFPNAVNFGSSMIQNVYSFTNGTSLEFTVPSYVGGTYPVSVSNKNGTSNTINFTVSIY